MTIRPANHQDLGSLTNLFEGYRTFYKKPSDPAGAKAFLNERIHQEDSKIYVCENAKHQLCGFVQLYPLFSSTRIKKLWLLNDLFVHPEARGLGISKKLIERAKELVKETSAAGMILETGISNKIGNQLYPKTGFKLIDKSNFYEWSNPDS